MVLKARIWQQVQLFLALWVIPAGPVAVALGTVYALGWPAWGIGLLVLAITWPVAWYIWLMGDNNAVPR